MKRRGRVARWFDRRGFGFLLDADTGREFFFHHSAIVSDEPYKTAVVGERVEFELKASENGKPPVAAFVLRLKDDDP